MHLKGDKIWNHRRTEAFTDHAVTPCYSVSTGILFFSPPGVFPNCAFVCLFICYITISMTGLFEGKATLLGLPWYTLCQQSDWFVIGLHYILLGFTESVDENLLWEFTVCNRKLVAIGYREEKDSPL